MNKVEKEYRELVKSGMFFDFYPSLTGDWERDKEEWFEIHSKLEDLRASFIRDGYELKIIDNSGERIKTRLK